MHFINFKTPFACQHRSVGLQSDDPVLLEPHHEVFLSHSGAQIEFVEQLCVDLESCHRFPFLDKRPASLPNRERFPDVMKAAVAQCEMMVVVVSEEHFTSKWPMILFNGFMQAYKGKDKSKKIMPLFYGLNVDEFHDSDRQEKWFTTWETMAKDDYRIKVDEWKESLKMLGYFKGLEYDRHSKDVVAYREEIVSIICKAIPPRPPRPQAAMHDEDMVGPPWPRNDEDEDDEEEDEVDEDEYRVPLSNEILLKGHTKACNPPFFEPRGWSTDVQMYEQVFVHVVLCNFMKYTINMSLFYFCMLSKSLLSMKWIKSSN